MIITGINREATPKPTCRSMLSLRARLAPERKVSVELTICICLTLSFSVLGSTTYFDVDVAVTITGDLLAIAKLGTIDDCATDANSLTELVG